MQKFFYRHYLLIEHCEKSRDSFKSLLDDNCGPLQLLDVNKYDPNSPLPRPFIWNIYDPLSLNSILNSLLLRVVIRIIMTPYNP